MWDSRSIAIRDEEARLLSRELPDVLSPAGDCCISTVGVPELKLRLLLLRTAESPLVLRSSSSASARRRPGVCLNLGLKCSHAYLNDTSASTPSRLHTLLYISAVEEEEENKRFVRLSHEAPNP
jgi:hypothetical protein